MISDRELWEISLCDSKYDDPVRAPTAATLAKELMAYRKAFEVAKDQIYGLSVLRLPDLSWMLSREHYWLCVGHMLARIEGLVCADSTLAER